MKHQLAFGWYAFLALVAALNLILLAAERIQHGPGDNWWHPILFAALTAYTLTRAVATAKKNWSTK